MAAPKKKRVVEEDMEIPDAGSDPEADGDCIGEESEDDEEVVNEEILVDFEARNPEDCDFHGIRKLLGQLFLKANINISEITDTIIEQNYIGSVIMQSEVDEEMDDGEDDDSDTYDILGVLSAINITDRKDKDFVKQLKTFLLDKCAQSSPKQKEKLAEILNHPSKQVGLVLSERLVNIPAQIAVPSYQALHTEIEEAKKKKMKYNFEYLLMISKSMHLSVPDDKKGSKTPETPTVFTNAEDEYFHKESVFTFEYSVANEHDTIMSGEWDDEQDVYIPYRTVMFIPGNKLPAFVDSIKQSLALPQ